MAKGSEDSIDDLVTNAKTLEERAAKLIPSGKDASPPIQKGTRSNVIFKTLMSSAKDRAKAGELLEKRGEYPQAADQYELAFDAAQTARNHREDGTTQYKTAGTAMSDYQQNMERTDSMTSGDASETIFGGLLGISFIFALDLMAPKITGNAIGSGNTPIDMGAGLLLLAACFMAAFFLVRKNSLKPAPHPEKKKKAKKKRRK